MKQLFDDVSMKCSQLTTKSYSTSFSLGIRLLSKEIRGGIYAIYGFVRFADEIVDSFHDYDKNQLLEEFTSEMYKAIDKGISLNPILNSFQKTVNEYNIPKELIGQFLHSMEMDLDKNVYDRAGYEEYILGSAEVVGLMCLKIFVNGDAKEYERLKPFAMALGSAFQKINFLRDLHADFENLGRSYFPGLKVEDLTKRIRKKLKMKYPKTSNWPMKESFNYQKRHDLEYI